MTAPVPEPAPVGPRRYFNRDGIRAYAAAHAVQAIGPLRYGVDGRFWAYEGGVWVSGERQLHVRICKMLGDLYRPGYSETIRHVLRAEVDELTMAPFMRMVNMSNGMVEWNAEPEPEEWPHHEMYVSTVQLPVRWNPDARCREFEAFLDEAVAIDDHARVWEMLGYLMMSGNPLQRIFLLVGGGGNGKGVLLNVIMHLLGQGNVSNVPLADFATDKFATAELFGKLANVCGDIDATYIESTGRIKELAGEDRLKGERKYGQPFYFEFWGKNVFSANGIPASSDSSSGWTRRFEVINFPNEPATPDRGLKRRLVEPEQLEGIAYRAIMALRGLMVRGEFDRGESAARVHAEFAQRNNKVLAWIEDVGYMDPSAWYPRGDLLKDFRWWDGRENPGARSMGSQTFYEKLRQVKGMREAIRQGVRGFAGFRLNASVHLITADSETAPDDEVQFQKQGQFDL